ncbi:MAG TPA: AEC family transporter [Anaerolineae bacterium]|nr:AEC family transporter [Anaerolineae bacterium]
MPMSIVTTIIPVFAIIILGLFSRRAGFIKPAFLEPANQLVYHLAIPAMIFRSISRASLKTQFDITVLTITLFSVLAVFVVAWVVGSIARVKRKQIGTFIQSSFHGNLGYIGLAVAYYCLGDKGLVRAGIIAGFIMILQNLLAVVVLQLYSTDISEKKSKTKLAWKILGNPVILSAMAGMLFSFTEVPIPLVIDRILDIISGMALPMALLLIGASLSFKLIRLRALLVLSSSIMKLILLPGLGFILYRLLDIAPQDFLPGLILLASPTATVSYVMAKELGGDTDFSVAAISISTILSAITFSIWLNMMAS